jgi:hypothetical protein
MNCSEYGANWFAGSRTALLAQNWLEGSSFHIRVHTTPEAFGSDPVHRPVICRVRLTDERNIVFHAAGYYASLAACAKILIDDHSPFARFFQTCMGCEIRDFGLRHSHLYC